MNCDSFSDFNLAGGTSLALQKGHRKSIDIDLFGNSEIYSDDFIEILSGFGKVITLKRSKNILILSVDGIKVDFVNYKYPLLESIKVIDNIRLVSQPDIAAMKLNAIVGRGSKKDFIDLYFLLQTYSLQEMISFFNKKFADGSEFMVLKSLHYFDDADLEEMPEMTNPIHWDEIKAKIKSL
jgi:predicted nucleotidyltransferase